MNNQHECNLCGGTDLTELINFGEFPVAKHYLTRPDEVRPVWPVKLYFCEHCGLSQLVDACPPEVVYANYVTLSAWKFQPHLQSQIALIKTLAGMDSESGIIEIGCNDGGFLRQLKLEGFSNAVGVEPAADAYQLAVAKDVEVINDFLTPELARKIVAERGQFNLFVSRQNLEHMSDLRGVAASIETLVQPGGYVLIEVPNFECNLRTHDYGLWEEHVNYFTRDTLREFLARANVEIVHCETFLFSGEGIFVVARKKEQVPSDLSYVPVLRSQNLEYAAQWQPFIRDINQQLVQFRSEGKKIAVYGAGSRGFCLLNFTRMTGHIDFIVDDQPEKQNTWMPGTGLPIVSSDALYEEGVAICLLGVNTENEEKVLKRHEKWIAGGGQFWSIFPPSERMLPAWRKYLR